MPDGIGREFMEKTRYSHLGPSDQQRGAPPPPLFLAAGRPGKKIQLPPPEEGNPGSRDVYSLITGRRSRRKFLAEPLSREKLSFLLWSTQGLKDVMHQVATLRTVPSAGARHALETYILVNHVEGVEPGVYHYLPPEHSLVLVNAQEGLSGQIAEACFGQRFVADCAATFIWSAVPYRMNWRYGERGYRYLHLDAGHVCQNLYLAAEAVGGGVCAVAAYDDDALNGLLGLNGVDEFVIYLAAMGLVPAGKGSGA